MADARIVQFPAPKKHQNAKIRHSFRTGKVRHEHPTVLTERSRSVDQKIGIQAPSFEDGFLLE
ncbi:MAG TPA: hypothetical protein DD001_00615 [Microcoleaceae bacterium UBA10368]|jgi:hypothetical protein|nr:hypothetical protein [Microcoleaceae cyanobacterium UBA10368]